jgi:hypothetical protein
MIWIALEPFQDTDTMTRHDLNQMIVSTSQRYSNFDGRSQGFSSASKTRTGKKKQASGIL